MNVEAAAMHQTSNIPGLGDFSGPTDEDKFGRGRKWIRETDSDYVKLAKQGGHKGLLSFEDEIAEKASSGRDEKDEDPAFLNLGPATEDTKKAPYWAIPDYMHHIEYQKSKGTEGYRPLTVPFGTDSNVSWERKKYDWITDAGLLRRPEFGRRQPKALDASICTNLENLSGQVDRQEMMQAKSLSRKRNESVSMQKLLSFGYVNDHNIGRNDKEEKEHHDTDMGLCHQL